VRRRQTKGFFVLEAWKKLRSVDVRLLSELFCGSIKGKSIHVKKTLEERAWAIFPSKSL
jgi:hypothetical protein